MRRKEGVPHTKERGKEKGEPKQLQHKKSVKGKNIMKRTRTPKRSALPRKMTALFLTLILLLPLFCFGSYALEEDTEPKILYEDVSKRSETEKHFVCSDGSGIAVSYGQEVHQPDGKGSFEDLDNRLILNSETRRYENTGNRRFSVSLATTSAGQPVTVQAESAPALSLVTRVMKNGLTLSPELFPFGLQAEVGSANAFCGQKVADATFELGSFVTSLTSSTAYGLFSGISSKYTLVGNGLKEEIILERNTGVVGFQTEYTVAGLTAAANGDGSLSFFDPAGQTVYSVSSPYVFDAAGSVCPAVAVLLRQTVTGYAVTYTPDAAWLSSGERVYPITFDPLVSNGTLNRNLLTAKTYTDNGTTVTETNGQLSVGFDKSVTPVGRTYTSLYISSLGYPSVNTDYYEIQSLTLTLTIKEKTGVSGLYNYRLGAGENPLSAGFEPSGEIFSTNVISQTSTTTAVSLPLDYYETGSTPTYLLMPRIRTTESGTKSVSYYGPAESDRQKRPVLKVTYSLRENFDEKVGFIGRTDGGVTRYLCLNENNSLAVSTTPYRWIFEEYLTRYGDYVIRSFEDSDYCLKAGANNTVTAVTYPVMPEEPSTKHFWTPILHNSAFDSYLFYSNAGGGFLHLNTADSTLTLSGSSGIDEHAWVVVEDVSLDVGNFTFVNLGTNAHLAVGQSQEQTVPARLTGAPENYTETWIPVRLEDGYYRFQTQINSGKLLKADGTALTVGTATDDSTKWTVKMDEQSGGYSLKNKSTGTILADINGTLSLVTEPALPNASHLWKPVDFFALQAAPEDRVEFALHHLQSGKYLQYGSVFSSTSDGALTAESFNVVVDQTVADSSQSSGYTAQTRSVCQRFTFEKKDVEGDVYYHILPLLRVDEEVKCVYRSEYRLVSENGTVKVKEMTVTEATVEDPTSGRWRLQQTAGGKYLIKNVATGTYLNVENDTVCLTQQQPRSTLWELKAISLAMEKDYQQYTNTCGAASGKMIVNYLIGSRNIDVSSYPEATFCDHQFIRKYREVNGIDYSSQNGIGYIRDTINSIVGSQLYTCNWDSLDNKALSFRIVKSLNQGCPVLIQIKPLIDQASVVGYYYQQNDNKGHYFVVKGCYYNSTTGEYDSVVNETHYKFGATSVSSYSWSETHSHPQSKAPGGRDLVLTSNLLHTIYDQRYHGMIYKA